MDYLYLFKLFYNNIDSVIISLITGVITSLFITRIFFIKEFEDDKVKRLREHSELLHLLNGYFISILENSNHETYLDSDILRPLKEDILYECRSFSRMDFSDLDKSLYTIAVKNNDLVEDISSYISNKKNIPLDIIKFWSKEIITINQLYNIRYNRKAHNKIIYKNIFIDKFVLIIILLIVVCILIA